MAVKPQVSEEESARTFVLEMVQTVSANWPTITEGWRPYVRGNSDPIDSPWAMHEFILSAATCQLRNLRGWFSPEQADRLRDLTVAALATPDLGVSALDGAQEYEKAFRDAQAAMQPPFYYVAHTYFSRIAGRLPPGALGEDYRQPPLLLAVGQSIANICARFWRDHAARYRVTP